MMLCQSSVVACGTDTGLKMPAQLTQTLDDVRVGLNVTYNVGWLRQEENQYLSVPREIAETLDDDLLKLMGYRIGAYALGYIDDVRDPLQALRGRPTTTSQGFTST